jgi:hypothetical protein
MGALMIICGYKSTILFIAAGLLFVVVLYFLHKTENNEQEKFQFLSQDLLNNNMNFPLNIINTPQFNNNPTAEQMRFKAQINQLPIYSKNISNNNQVIQ